MTKNMKCFLLLFILTSCATQPMPEGYNLPGFWSGLWHGIVAPIALIAEIFTDVRVYEFPNNGGWYDWGFMWGLLGLWGGGSVAASR